MHVRFATAAFIPALAVMAFAQTPEPTPAQQDPSTLKSARTTASASMPSGQMYKGVLMDASCSAIQTKLSSMNTSETTRAKTETATATTASASSQTGGATANTPSGAGTSGSLSSTTNSGGTATSPTTATETPATTSAKTGVSTDQSGNATSNTSTATTASASGAGTSGSNSVTSYTGTTGSGDRNRKMDTDTSTAGSQWVTVREKYKDCKPTASTTSFAIMSNGELYLVDDASGTLKQRVSNNTDTDWHSVSINGSLTGNRLNATSIQ